MENKIKLAVAKYIKETNDIPNCVMISNGNYNKIKNKTGCLYFNIYGCGVIAQRMPANVIMVGNFNVYYKEDLKQ